MPDRPSARPATWSRSAEVRQAQSVSAGVAVRQSWWSRYRSVPTTRPPKHGPLAAPPTGGTPSVPGTPHRGVSGPGTSRPWCQPPSPATGPSAPRVRNSPEARNRQSVRPKARPRGPRHTPALAHGHRVRSPQARDRGARSATSRRCCAGSRPPPDHSGRRRPPGVRGNVASPSTRPAPSVRMGQPPGPPHGPVS